jgi:hypothetical protein
MRPYRNVRTGFVATCLVDATLAATYRPPEHVAGEHNADRLCRLEVGQLHALDIVDGDLVLRMEVITRHFWRER